MVQVDKTHKKGLSLYWGKNRDIRVAFGSQFLIRSNQFNHIDTVLLRWDIAKEAAEWIEVEGGYNEDTDIDSPQDVS